MDCDYQNCFSCTGVESFPAHVHVNEKQPTSRREAGHEVHTIWDSSGCSTYKHLVALLPEGQAVAIGTLKLASSLEDFHHGEPILHSLFPP